jgi:2-polyprenyl-3-methyl-5-hydroxy-6-metoxy-1,4-benzoquinol methylase
MRTRKFLKRLTGRKRRRELSELGTSAIHWAVLRAVEQAAPEELSGDHLDVGSGTGELLRLCAGRYPLRSFACDYTERLMEMRGQKVEVVDLNCGPLPFENNRFALITCTETIEHLENYQQIVREIFRVLQPGGIAVVSTPNILNLRSRLRFLSSGFYNLFGPLVLDEPNIHGTRGHINPINWFYLAHALLSAGFQNLRVTVDKYQRRSFLALAFLFLPIRAANWIVYRRDMNKYRTLNIDNVWAVRLMNSSKLLLGRTLIVSATKPQ